MEEKKKNLSNKIRWWDSQEEQRGLTRDEKSLRDVVKQDFERVLALEEIKWRQKSKFQ